MPSSRELVFRGDRPVVEKNKENAEHSCVRASGDDPASPGHVCETI